MRRSRRKRNLPKNHVRQRHCHWSDKTHKKCAVKVKIAFENFLNFSSISLFCLRLSMIEEKGHFIAQYDSKMRHLSSFWTGDGDCPALKFKCEMPLGKGWSFELTGIQYYVFILRPFSLESYKTRLILTIFKSVESYDLIGWKFEWNMHCLFNTCKSLFLFPKKHFWTIFIKQPPKLGRFSECYFEPCV